MLKLYCLEDFKVEIEKLSKKKPYASLEAEVLKHFYGKTMEEARSGVLLNASNTTPYVKKRLKGSGGYRVYFLAIIKDYCLYLLFVHPKTGPEGSSNVTDEAKADFLNQAIDAIASDKGLYEVTPDAKKKKLVFTEKQEAPTAPVLTTDFAAE